MTRTSFVKALLLGGGGNRFFLIAILAFPLILSNLSAITLQEICSNPNNCTINTPQNEITNSGYFTINGDNAIDINAQIDTFINYGNLDVSNNNNETFRFSTDANKTYGHITHLINYGTIKASFWIANNSGGVSTLTNYGYIGGDIYQDVPHTMTLNNLGIIAGKTAHLGTGNNGKILIQNYMLKLNETTMNFNAFNGNGDKNSHLVINANNSSSGGSVRFKDSDSKIILDFGLDFEFGAKYLISKVAVNQTGATPALGVDFDRLVPRSDLFTLTQSGEYFIATLNTGASAIGNLYKSNIRTMNNFYTMSNSMIYPHKYSAKRTTNKRRVIRRVKKTANLFNDSTESPLIRHSELSLESEESTNLNKGLDSNLDSFALDSSLRALHYAQNDGESVPFASLRESALADSWQSKSHDFNQLQSTMNQEQINDLDLWIASSATLPRNDEFLDLESLESHESFAYKSDSNDYYANNATNPNSTNQTRRPITTTNSTNPISNPNANRNPQITQSNDKYYFILTPFVNHNLFFESGRYNLSGLEYGFLTAFSGKITPSNTLGAHFMMSYGSLGDLNDKNFSITNLNLNIGLNYKFDMIWDMYLKARGDFYYFLNQVKTLTIFEAIKPNNLGFGLSVAYGKDFNFGKGGTLGIEGGIDYKALQVSNISLQNSADRSVSEIYQKSLYNLIYVDLGLNYAKYFNTSVGLWGLNANMGIKGNVSANKLAKSQILLNAFNRSVDMTLDNDKVLGYVNLSGSYVLNAKDFNMEFSIAYYGNYGDRVVSNGGGFEWRVVW